MPDPDIFGILNYAYSTLLFYRRAFIARRFLLPEKKKYAIIFLYFDSCKKEEGKNDERIYKNYGRQYRKRASLLHYTRKKPHPGVEKKRAWLLNRLKDGHVFLKLNEKATVFIEYEPIETAWVPISGRRYLYIPCLWVLGEYKGKGYGTELMKYAIADAKAQGKAGLCMLGAKKHGFPISPLPKNSDSPKSIPRPTVINYSLCLSIKTQKNPRCPLSRRAHASAK